MAKKTSIMNIVTTKIGLLTAVSVVILAAVFLRSSYEVVRMFLLDMLMGFGVTNEYQQQIVIIIVAGVILYFIGRNRLKGMLK